ncbi:precorrin-3B synthase [Streptomyces sp. G-G2]|uniref:precorrin-3B synthase n=1 Tax=Streptomyces sp. G-G2 TaxID=3046201 RepID=UPI0024BA5A53|nr:precorrin-3B synthase [Streptomyces sp. G-G2]MDJ0383695.1 precorrin-3B synthase [Streptomyces sp. G-G2]
MPPPSSAAPRDEPVIRDRGDACPGALRLHAADDGYLARVRIPGGLLTSGAAAVLAGAADRLGDGHLDLTSRGNVQLRGLGASCGGELAELLGAAGLLPPAAATHERVRNIVASPLSGLDGQGNADVTPWVGALDRQLCASGAAAGLSGRFLFALDDGRGDVTSLAPDVSLLALGAGTAALWTRDVSEAVRIGHQDAPEAALVAAEYFLDAVRSAGTKAWRVSELPAEHQLESDELLRRLRERGIRAESADQAGGGFVRPRRTVGPRPGVLAGPDGTRVALSALAPLGRLTTTQWRLLAASASAGSGELRLTPWRGIVVPGCDAATAPEALARLAGAGLVTRPGDPWEHVTACTGRPGCGKALADVRADARAVVSLHRAVAAPGDAAGPAGPAGAALPVHWSGCERRCGHPRAAAWVDLVAGPGGYGLAVAGAAAAGAGSGATGSGPVGRAVREGVPATAADLAAALAEAHRTPDPPTSRQTQQQTQ